MYHEIYAFIYYHGYRYTKNASKYQRLCDKIAGYSHHSFLTVAGIFCAPYYTAAVAFPLFAIREIPVSIPGIYNNFFLGYSHCDKLHETYLLYLN